MTTGLGSHNALTAQIPEELTALRQLRALGTGINGFQEIEVELDSAGDILWCYMDQTGRPCYTYELGEEIRAVQGWIRNYFRDRDPSDDPLFRYFVCGSKMPGIYNLGGDLQHFVERIRDRDLAALRRYAHICVELQAANANAFDSPIVTIALVQGDALGGGFEHALAFDLIVAERSAKLGLPEVLFNLFPGMGAYSFLSRRLDRRTAEEFIMSGRIYSAEELYKLGVVDVLAEDGEGEAAVRAHIASHRRKFNTQRAIYEARRRVNPVTFAELVAITDIWADTALTLSEHDLKKMERLAAAQDKRVAALRGPIHLVE